jgi:iron-sulfur cluster assembly protein
MITITEKAVEAIRDSIVEENKAVDDSYLRVSVKGGGCSGMMYDLSIDSEQQADDLLIEQEDVRVLVDPKSQLFLRGMMLDFTTGLNGKGFVFSNPNAKGTCGCGESFTV